MLVHQKFTPERKTGWNLVDSTDSQYKAQLLGVKIVSILTNKYKK